MSKGHKHTLRLEDCCQSEIECGGLLSKQQNEKLRLADCCHFQARLEDYSQRSMEYKINETQPSQKCGGFCLRKTCLAMYPSLSDE